MLKDKMNKQFNSEERRVLKILNYEYHETLNQWSLSYSKSPSELFVVETQLGYSKYKARKMIIKALHIFDKHSKDEVLNWLGY